MVLLTAHDVYQTTREQSISSNNLRIDVVQLRKLTRVIQSQKDQYISVRIV